MLLGDTVNPMDVVQDTLLQSKLLFALTFTSLHLMHLFPLKFYCCFHLAVESWLGACNKTGWFGRGSWVWVKMSLYFYRFHMRIRRRVAPKNITENDPFTQNLIKQWSVPMKMCILIRTDDEMDDAPLEQRGKLIKHQESQRNPSVNVLGKDQVNPAETSG